MELKLTDKQAYAAVNEFVDLAYFGRLGIERLATMLQYEQPAVAPAVDINRLSLDVIQIAESALYHLRYVEIEEVRVRLEQIIQRVDQTAK